MKKSRNVQPFKGKAPLNASLTNTSAAGAFVQTVFQIDTTLCPDWTTWGQTFVNWRIKHITFHFEPIKGTTTEGTFGIAIMDDPNGTNPTSTSTALGCRLATFGHVYDKLKLKFMPVNKKMLYTRDPSGTDDRLEMPGKVVFWSENTSSAFVPGVPWMEFSLEFEGVTNSTVSPNPKSLICKHSDVNNTPVDDNPDDPDEDQNAKQLYLTELARLRSKYSAILRR